MSSSSWVHDLLIPFDIQTEILKRMNDMRSLIRFRSVSKAWKSLIDSPNFVADHHHHQSAAGRRHLILVHDIGESDEQNYVSIIVDDDDSFPRDQYCMTTLPSTLSDKPYHRSIGSSDGLLGYDLGYYRGFVDSPYAILLWNPSIRRSVVIGVPLPYVSEGHTYSTYVGFGVCPGTSDPKLVKIVTSSRDVLITFDEDDDDLMPWQVEVYTLSSGIWRSPLCCSSSKQMPRKSIILRWEPVVINGIIYWRAWDRCNDMIIAFDLTTEEFEEINLPDNLANRHDHMCLAIANRRESLVVLEYRSWRDVNVWVMNSTSGVPKSFTKLYSVVINKKWCSFDIKEFRKNGDPILEIERFFRDRYYNGQLTRTLELYEPCSDHQRYIDLGFCGRKSVTCYTETLLLLDHHHQSSDSFRNDVRLIYDGHVACSN